MKAESMESLIGRIVQRELGQKAGKMIRQTTGFCNEVYSVALPKKSVIIRLNLNPDVMIGSRKNIQVFRERGIKVPSIIKEDYSRGVYPYAYQIMSKIPGRDLGQVIKELNHPQLQAIAGQVASVFRKLHGLHTNGRYGYVGANDDKKGLFHSWTAYINHGIRRNIRRSRKTGVMDDGLIQAIRKLLSDNRPYFDSVPSKLYFDDLTSKNVMVYRGKFTGIVDLDGVMYGDYLEAVGRIEASWFGTKYGDFYTRAVMDELDLSPKQRRIAALYAVLNRVDWLSERGEQRHRNSLGKIDWVGVNGDKRIIRAMFDDINL